MVFGFYTMIKLRNWDRMGLNNAEKKFGVFFCQKKSNQFTYINSFVRYKSKQIMFYLAGNDD